MALSSSCLKKRIKGLYLFAVCVCVGESKVIERAVGGLVLFADGLKWLLVI